MPSLDSQPVKTNGIHATNAYTIPNTPLGYRRPIKVIVIGFGFSGINLSYILNKKTKNSNITLQFYDKNPEAGGTWFENRYPGCACDVPIVNYQFTWHPKPDWPRYCSHHKLDSSVKLSHEVTGAWWDSDQGQWKVQIQPNNQPENAFFDYAEVLINATGALNDWKWPSIPGLEKFKNKTHTAAWDDTIDLTDKTVGIIGNGSSSVQVTTTIRDKVKHLHVFLRSATWVTTGFASKYGGEDGSNPEYSEEQKRRFSENPEEYLAYRKAVEREMNSSFAMAIQGTKEQKNAAEFAKNAMIMKLKSKPELIEKLIPTDFAVGCRRPIPGNGYLETITSDKCDTTFSPIIEITEEGVITADKTLHKIDALVCGTGFDVSYKPRFPIFGIKGLDLADEFRDSPETYLSTMTPGFPNYFMALGPFAPYGHGSIIPAIEVIGRNIALVLEKFQTQNIKSVAPKKEAVEDFKQHREQYLKRTIWNAPCSAWFKLGPNGENIMMWPGSRLHSFDVLLKPRWEDYDWEYLYGNRYSYWGNGFTLVDESEQEHDKTWYIGGV